MNEELHALTEMQRKAHGTISMTPNNISFRLSYDQSTIIVDRTELTAEGRKIVESAEAIALCHTCQAQADMKSQRKPYKWALHYAGTLHNPKRFFICDDCSKGILQWAKS